MRMRPLAILLCLLSVMMDMSASQPFDSLKKSLTTGNDTCPPWQVKNPATNKCICDAENIDFIVTCSNNPYQPNAT